MKALVGVFVCFVLFIPGEVLLDNCNSTFTLYMSLRNGTIEKPSFHSKPWKQYVERHSHSTRKSGWMKE